jgi:hypothetical protein
MSAIRPFVHSHCRLPSPHTNRQCRSVSVSPHKRHLSSGAIRILCRRSFVGKMSCIILYHIARLSPVIGSNHKFLHTLSQSVLDHIVSIRILVGVVSPLNRSRSISYVLRLYFLLYPSVLGDQCMQCPTPESAGITNALVSGQMWRVSTVMLQFPSLQPPVLYCSFNSALDLETIY